MNPESAADTGQPLGSAPGAGLKSLSVRGGLFTALSRAGSQLVRLAAMLVLARALTPGDFGLVAMVVSTVGVANIFRDLGLSASIVQREAISNSEVSALFWIGVGTGAALLLTGFAIAPGVAAILHQPKAEAVTRVLSLSFVVTALSAPLQALLSRDMRFGDIAKINLAGAVASNGAAVALAVGGFGYWSLVWSSLIGDVTETALCWRFCDWRPQRPARQPGVIPMLSFGGHLVGFNLLGYLANNLQNVLIGQRWGSTAAGHYSRAYFLVQLPLVYVNDPLSAVAVPAMTRLVKDPARYRDYYLTCVRITLMAAAPAAVACALFAGEIVQAVLGGQWQRSTSLLRLLTLSLVLQPLCHSAGWLYLSRGDSRGMLRWGLAGWTVVIAGIVAGLPFGLEGVAAAHSLSLLVLTVPCMKVAFKGTSLSLTSFAQVCWRPVVAAAVAAIPVLFLDALAVLSGWARLMGGGAIYAVGYVLLSEVLGERRFITEVLRHVRTERQLA